MTKINIDSDFALDSALTARESPVRTLFEMSTSDISRKLAPVSGVPNCDLDQRPAAVREETLATACRQSLCRRPLFARASFVRRLCDAHHLSSRSLESTSLSLTRVQGGEPNSRSFESVAKTGKPGLFPETARTEGRKKRMRLSGDDLGG